MDDGARVSTVSVAWWDHDQQEAVGLAWPFDQGALDKELPPKVDREALVWEQAAQSHNLPETEWRALLKWLALVGESDGLVMHNAKFDCHILAAGHRKYGGRASNRIADRVIWDTQLTNTLIWPLALDPKTKRRTASLKPTAMRLWGEQEGDEQAVVKDYLRRHKLPSGRWDLIPWAVIGKYARRDAEMTIRLYMRQRTDIEQGRAGKWLDQPGGEVGAGALAAVDWQLQVMRTLFREERRGVAYDVAESRRVAEVLLARRDEVQQRMKHKPTLPGAKDYFFGQGEGSLGLQPYETTPTGAAKLTENDTAKLLRDEVPGAQEWRDYQKLTRAVGTWYEAYADAVGPDGRLRTSFRQSGTVSGRFSCERVNLQAIPQNYRLSGFDVMAGVPTPRDLIGRGVKLTPGWKLWELDLSQAELRLAANWAGCETMLGLIRDGQDIHGATAAEMFQTSEDDPNWDLYRQVGKRANFSLIFGSGADTFREMLATQLNLYWERDRAVEIVRRWNNLYPEFKIAINNHMGKVEQRQAKGRWGDPASGGWIGTWGRNRRWFDRYEDAHKAFNQRVQGALAVLSQRWVVATDQHLMKAGYGVACDGSDGGLLLQVHDSVVLQLPATDEGDTLAQQIRAVGRAIWDEMFPGLPGDIDTKEWTG